MMRIRCHHRWARVFAAAASSTAGLYGALQCHVVAAAPSTVSGGLASASSPGNDFDSARMRAPVGFIASDEDLNQVVKGQTVLLMSRGYDRSERKSARANFEAAAKSWLERHPTSPLKFVVLDDETPKPQADAFIARIGVVHPLPFVMILDEFLVKEHKYLTADKRTPSTSGILKFLEDFSSQKLKPALMGQPRPLNDRSETCKTLFEVVTDSFSAIVLDPKYDVLIEAYTPRCDACKAFSPRYRMFSTLCSFHFPLLRVAAMNILDNDRPTEYMPEKWTPSLRFFPSSDTPVKRNILFDYEALVAGNNSSEATAGHKIVLPTVPELLDFVLRFAKHPPIDVEQAKKDAEFLEEEAVILERLYAQVLDYMQVWAAYNDAINAMPPEEFRSLTTAAGAKQAPFAFHTSSEERAIAKELQRRIIGAHKYIATQASAGSSERALETVNSIASFIEAKQIAERIQNTFESGD